MITLKRRWILPVTAVLAACGSSTMPETRLDQPVPAALVDVPAASGGAPQTAVLAGGCFWGVEAVFEHVDGVVSVVSGYAGGTQETAHYEVVGTGTTGHAESVRVTFDPARITYGQILRIFFSVAHDPTQRNAQYPDSGPQYRSDIFYATEQQRTVALAYISQLDGARVFSRPIATRVDPLVAFYPAEDEHQDYLAQHRDEPYIVTFDLPKLTLLGRFFPELYRAP